MHTHISITLHTKSNLSSKAKEALLLGYIYKKGTTRFVAVRTLNLGKSTGRVTVDSFEIMLKSEM